MAVLPVTRSHWFMGKGVKTWEIKLDEAFDIITISYKSSESVPYLYIDYLWHTTPGDLNTNNAAQVSNIWLDMGAGSSLSGESLYIYAQQFGSQTVNLEIEVTGENYNEVVITDPLDDIEDEVLDDILTEETDVEDKIDVIEDTTDKETDDTITDGESKTDDATDTAKEDNKIIIDDADLYKTAVINNIKINMDGILDGVAGIMSESNYEVSNSVDLMADRTEDTIIDLGDTIITGLKKVLEGLETALSFAIGLLLKGVSFAIKGIGKNIWESFMDTFFEQEVED